MRIKMVSALTATSSILHSGAPKGTHPIVVFTSEGTARFRIRKC
jgi:hypothetical protein